MNIETIAVFGASITRPPNGLDGLSEDSLVFVVPGLALYVLVALLLLSANVRALRHTHQLAKREVREVLKAHELDMSDDEPPVRNAEKLWLYVCQLPWAVSRGARKVVEYLRRIG